MARRTPKPLASAPRTEIEGTTDAGAGAGAKHRVRHEERQQPRTHPSRYQYQCRNQQNHRLKKQNWEPPPPRKERECLSNNSHQQKKILIMIVKTSGSQVLSPGPVEKGKKEKEGWEKWETYANTHSGTRCQLGKKGTAHWATWRRWRRRKWNDARSAGREGIRGEGKRREARMGGWWGEDEGSGGEGRGDKERGCASSVEVVERGMGGGEGREIWLCVKF